ncbi:MAG: hypothetical protein JW894_10510 [Bacteroidales bacterium]|nr:hypothetical protein [Bacteroidales bacterium]
MERLFYLRDFRVKDSKGNITAYCVSEWLLIDVKAKRPKLIPVEEDFFLHNTAVERAISSRVRILNSLPKITDQCTYNVKYSDIDLNKHLTSTGYIDKMFDTFDINFLNTNQCSEIVLIFCVKYLPTKL